jgi:hypothetical protein
MSVIMVSCPVKKQPTGKGARSKNLPRMCPSRMGDAPGLSAGGTCTPWGYRHALPAPLRGREEREARVVGEFQTSRCLRVTAPRKTVL